MALEELFAGRSPLRQRPHRNSHRLCRLYGILEVEGLWRIRAAAPGFSFEKQPARSPGPRKFPKEDKAVLGICRGIQYLNAMLGGSLYQDLNVQHPSKTEHHMEPPYDRVIHQVQIIDGTPLHQLLQVTELGVNSYHHQAVKTLAPLLTVMAESEDGLVEAVYMSEKSYVWAVQWHPELSYQTDKYSRKIFESFVAACK